ncbi:8647_t:CDS:2, partial [Ambispora gerdemannii]
MPNIPTPSGDKKYIFADARKNAFVPSTINMHQNDTLVFVADKSDSWNSFSYYINQNKKTCDKDTSSSSVSLGKGSSNDGISTLGTFYSSLAPG